MILFYISDFPKVSQRLTQCIVLQGPNRRQSSTTTVRDSAAAGASEDIQTFSLKSWQCIWTAVGVIQLADINASCSLVCLRFRKCVCGLVVCLYCERSSSLHISMIFSDATTFIPNCSYNNAKLDLCKRLWGGRWRRRQHQQTSRIFDVHLSSSAVAR